MLHLATDYVLVAVQMATYLDLFLVLNVHAQII